MPWKWKGASEMTNKPMTVGELIVKLKKFDKDIPVRINLSLPNPDFGGNQFEMGMPTELHHRRNLHELFQFDDKTLDLCSKSCGWDYANLSCRYEILLSHREIYIIATLLEEKMKIDWVDQEFKDFINQFYLKMNKFLSLIG